MHTHRTCCDAVGRQQLQPAPVVVPLCIVPHGQQCMQCLFKLGQAEAIIVVADVAQQQRHVWLRKLAAL